LAKYSVHFVSADLAKPGKKQGLASEAPHFSYDNAHGSLHNLFREFLVVVHPRERKTEQAWKILFEENIERDLITGRHFGGQ
jgi:hypothetical protein